MYTAPSLFQWKADNKRSPVLRLPRVPLPPRAKLWKNLLSEPEARRLVKQARSLETGNVTASLEPSAYSEQDIPVMPLVSGHRV